MNLLAIMALFLKNPLQARKTLTLHLALSKERQGFENYLNLPNKKLCQAIAN